MSKKFLVYFGIIAIFAIVGFFVISQEGNPKPENRQNIIKESYGINDACVFTVYQPIKQTSLTPSPNVSKEIQCNFKIHESLPLYTFQILGEEGKNDIARIQILREGNSQPVQTFSEFESYPSIERVFEIQDINFDGYIDIRTVAWHGTAGFTGYQYWVFNPETQLFDLSEQLRILANPRPDLTTQTILADSAQEGIVKYKWQNGELVKTE